MVISDTEPVDKDKFPVWINPKGDPTAFKDLIFTGAVSARYDGAASVTVEIPNGIPGSVPSDAGKFLRVDGSGSAQWQTVPNAKGVRF